MIKKDKEGLMSNTNEEWTGWESPSKLANEQLYSLEDNQEINHLPFVFEMDNYDGLDSVSPPKPQ